MIKSGQNLGKPLLIGLILLFLCITLLCVKAHAGETAYQVDIVAPSPLSQLLRKHLDIIKWRDNPRTTPAEWQRLSIAAPQNIKDLLATEGYFSPVINSSLTLTNGVSVAKFTVEPGPPVLIQDVTLHFTGDITQQTNKEQPNISKLQEDWLLKSGMPFRQEDWSQAKRGLLAALLIQRYPNASISQSSATVNVQTNTAALLVEVDSGASIHFGNLSIEGLKRYPASIIENLNPIKPNSIYSQSDLLTFQSRLQSSGYFRTVDIKTDTKASNADGSPSLIAPIKVVVEENRAVKVGLGAGYSTNMGARTQLTFDDLNLFGRGWWLTSALKVEQKAQLLSGQISLPTTAEGYRDSMSASAGHTTIQGETITATKAGIKRAWGPRKREQYIGANLITERIDVEGAASSSNHAATLAYGITLRHTDNDLNPIRGYLFNAQFAGAPLDALADGKFLQSYIKAQGYYPITASTQLIARAEMGMVNGKNSAPAAFLFRAGGDQSVRGYSYQSLGVTEGDAIVGGRYLATGSVELVQWLTPQWGAALFVDAGNAANTLQDLKPVYGYGLGARWKSPVGPIGADIAYGQKTGEYRMHFNIGVAF